MLWFRAKISTLRPPGTILSMMWYSWSGLRDFSLISANSKSFDVCVVRAKHRERDSGQSVDVTLTPAERW
jgi:hypothetical protein